MKQIFMVSFLISLFVSAGMAAEVFLPVQDIFLTYDSSKAVLHVEATHPSQNWELDYVRMMTVSLNGQISSTLNYAHQAGVKFVEDVPLTAKAGDVITVELFTTRAGSKSQDLTVTNAEISKTPSVDTGTEGN